MNKSVKLIIQWTCIILLPICLCEMVSGLGSSGLDNSWQIALNYINLHSEYKFGDNIFSTYGPLGYIAAPYNNMGNNVLYMLIFSIFFVVVHCVLLYGLFQYAGDSKRQWMKVLISCLLSLSFLNTNLDKYLVYLGIISLGLMWNGKRKNAYILDIILISLAFIKINAFEQMFAGYIFFILMKMLQKKKKEAGYYALHMMGSCVLIMCIYLLYNFSVYDFIKYIKYSLDISVGHCWGMSTPADTKSLIYLGIIILCYILVGLILALNDVEQSLFWLVFAPILFMEYKHGYVRADLGHLKKVYICLGSIIVGIIPFIHLKKLNDISKCSTVLLIAVIAALPGIMFPSIYKESIVGIRNNLKNMQHLYDRVVSLNTESDECNGIWEIREDWRKIIGSNSVCVFPWEVSYCMKYKEMNWKIMPVIQNYLAYTPALDAQNSAFYRERENAPEYIIFDLQTIDNRWALAESPDTWDAIRENYIVKEYDEDRKLFLLQRDIYEDRGGVMRVVQEDSVNIQEYIEIPETADYITLNCKVNFLGKIANILYKIPAVTMTVEYSDGTVDTKRIIMQNLQNRLYIKDIPQDPYSFLTTLNGYMEKRVVRICFGGEGLKYFKGKAEVIFESKDAVIKERNMNVEKLLTSVEPMNIIGQYSERMSKNMQYGIDYVNEHSYLYEINGWIYVEELENVEEYEVFMACDEVLYRLSRDIRNDVNAFLKLNSDYKAGYYGYFCKADKYELYVVDKAGRMYYRMPVILEQKT